MVSSNVKIFLKVLCWENKSIPPHTQLSVRSGEHVDIIADIYTHIGTKYNIDIALLHSHNDDNRHY